ncbi:SDR family oxidoreductase [Pseudomonas sp. W2Oct36]|jgi:NAD(P)-dependent dehydrogenase (short-subunit alcohol dehydrogenase family)|uniref:Short-chain dehydrogenase/reductase n=2 Tax=Pseudomonas TaxID=286 RepID=A0A1C2E0C0_9PSED|nr:MULTISPECIES: SDR family oxidoreductase [Pseudomonas]MBD8596431.1 SDR family oxidoreductase [Pseudomonas sp. CFBP 8772]OCX20383.1 short-chain dehydrogenase/reductase [Pseudomonas graminis]
MKTILITGCSSGFGLTTAQYFIDRNWKVIATMRTPDAALFKTSEHLRVLAVDVTDPDSIQNAIDVAGPIDVLVNNAGIGLLGALEGCSMQKIRSIFDTNTFGTMAMTQAVLPQFRQCSAGVVINVTSSVTIKSLPLLSIYTASKAAVNAFTESLALELEPFNIRVNLVLPGRAPGTDFGKNAQPRMQGSIPDAYADLAQRVFSEWSQSTLVTEAQDVAEAIWGAANDPGSPMRIAAGADAVALMGEAD